MQRHLLEEEHVLFEESFDTFVRQEIVPYHDQWEKDSIVSRDVWTKAGAQGFLCTDFPEQYGGLGMFDFRFHSIVNEVLCRHCASGPGFTLQNDIMAPYFITYFNNEQKERWMSGIASGEIITAIAMTEPRAGSDLAGIGTTAVDQGDHYLVNGAKTFITNGIHSDLVIVCVKTNPELKHKGISLLMVERGMEGFSRGKNLDKIGLKAQDTAELFFDNVKVPKANLLGEEGMGFYYLMHNLPQERLSLAVGAIASCEAVLDLTIQYCKDRKAFGQSIGSFQNSKFKLAEMKTEIDIGRNYIDQCILELNQDKLTAEKAAMAKWWVTELLGKVTDQCLQLHGGYGYMNEYAVAKFYRDARIARIYGGTTEIMKEIIGRSLGF